MVPFGVRAGVETIVSSKYTQEALIFGSTHSKWMSVQVLSYHALCGLDKLFNFSELQFFYLENYTYF